MIILTLRLLIISIIFPCLIIIERLTFTNSLLDDITIDFQNKSNKYLRFFFIFFSIIGKAEVISIISLLYFEFSNNKKESIYFLVSSSFLNFISTILKMIYSEFRPYMLNASILIINECPLDWGNPSGHSMNCFFFYFIMINKLRFLVLSNITFKLQKKSNKFEIEKFNKTSLKKNSSKIINLSEIKGKISKKKNYAIFFFNFLFIFFTFFIITNIGISRILVGAHSFNQVWIGFTFGIAFTIIYLETKKKFMEILEKLSKKASNFVLIAILFTLFIIFILSSWLNFYYKSVNFLISEQIKDAIEHKCNSIYNEEKSFYYQCFKSTSIISLPFGMIFGILIQSNKNNEYLNLNLDFRKNYCKISNLKKFLRLFVYLSLLVGIYFAFELVPDFLNIYIIFVIQLILKYFLIGISLTLFIPIIFKVFKMEIK